MNLHSLKCPNCKADLEVEDGLDEFFCKYCGSKIILEGQSDMAYRAKTKIKSMEHEENMIDKKYKHERYKIEQKSKQERSKVKLGIFIAIACIIGYFVLFGGYLGNLEKSQ